MMDVQTEDGIGGASSPSLTAEEVRVLGCLMEKARTTPDDYPLSRNALTRACNQTTNRDPVVHYDETTVAAALDSLKERRLVRFVHMASGRGVTKYRHVADEAWGLDERECAVVCMLALRGPQTVGELKTRGERLADFPNLEAVTATADALARRDAALVVQLERRPGRKEPRWTHLLLGEPLADTGMDAVDAPGTAGGARADRVSELETRCAELEARLVAVESRLRQVLVSLGEEIEDGATH